MKRALSVLVAVSFLIPADEALGQTTGAPAPRVEAPVTFVLDTVLFRLPRAQVPDTALITLGERRPSRRYYTMWARTGSGRPVRTECLLTRPGPVGIAEAIPSLRTDSTRAAPVRRYLVKCPLTTTGL